MDIEPTPPGSPEVKPPPSQETLSDILTAVDKLTEPAKVYSNSDVWKDKGYLLDPLKGWDKYTGLSVSRLTDEGRKKYPSHPEAVIRLFSRDEYGQRQIEYYLKNKEGKLEISRHDSVETDEDEKRHDRRKQRIGSISKQGAVRELKDLLAEVKEREGLHKMEDETGVSYVDAEEAQTLLDDLHKFIEQ